MRNIRNTAKILILILLLVFITSPVVVFAQEQVSRGQFIPCDGPDCTFGHLLQLVKNVLDWVVMISFPAAIISFAWAGFTYLHTGIVDKRTQAKTMLWKIVIGFAIILSAWLIVRTIVTVLLKPEYGDQFIRL